MTDPNKNGNQPRENLFEIMDNIVYQINNTKKIFITLIIIHLIIVPIGFAITFALFGPPFMWRGGHNGFGPFGLGPVIPIVVVLIWLGIGIRQWLVLSKWTKKYERYKELQKKAERELDYDTDEGKEEQQK